MRPERRRTPTPPDHDERPDRFRLARSVLREHGSIPDIHERVAQRLLAEGQTPVLDVGCGEGELARHLPEGAWIGVDSSRTMLADCPRAAGPRARERTSFPHALMGVQRALVEHVRGAVLAGKRGPSLAASARSAAKRAFTRLETGFATTANTPGGLE